MGIVTVECPNTGEQVPTGMVVDARTFATMELEGHKFRCDACAEVHSWNKATASPSPTRSGLRVGFRGQSDSDAQVADSSVNGEARAPRRIR